LPAVFVSRFLQNVEQMSKQGFGKSFGMKSSWQLSLSSFKEFRYKVEEKHWREKRRSST